MNAHLSPQQRAQLFVGARVSTRHSRISGLPENLWPRQSGVIIEDYSDLLEDTAHTYGRDWAIIRRYAIALDDGSLIFRDTNNRPRPGTLVPERPITFSSRALAPQTVANRGAEGADSVVVAVSVSVVVTVLCLTAHQFRCQFQQVQLGDGTTLDVHGGSQQGGVVGVPQLVVPRFQLGVDRCLVQCFPGAARMHPGVGEGFVAVRPADLNFRAGETVREIHHQRPHVPADVQHQRTTVHPRIFAHTAAC
jgi:hypothetical protein